MPIFAYPLGLRIFSNPFPLCPYNLKFMNIPVPNLPFIFNANILTIYLFQIVLSLISLHQIIYVNTKILNNNN
jgi:hypothetical protein